MLATSFTLQKELGDIRVAPFSFYLLYITNYVI